MKLRESILWRWLPVAVGAGLAIWHLGTQNLWTDEAMSLEAVGGSWSDLLRFFRGLPEQHPLYYLLLRFWLVFGNSEAALRSLSVIFFVASIPVIAMLGDRLGGRRAGTLTAWLAATSPFLIYYAQEARMYSLAGLLSATATFLLVRWLERPSWSLLGAYGVIGVLGCYTHFFFTFLILAHGLAAVAALGWRAPSLRHLLGAQLAIAIGYAPWIWMLVRYLGHGQDWKTGETVLFALPYTLLRFAVGYAVVPANFGWRGRLGELAAQDAPALGLALIGFGVLTFAGIVRLWRSGGVRRSFLVIGITPVILALIASSLVIIVSERYFVVVFPVFLVVTGAGLAELLFGTRTQRLAGRVGGVAVFLATLVALAKYFGNSDYGKEQWQVAADLVRKNRQPGDLIVVHANFALGVFKYYYRPRSDETILSNNDPRVLPPARRVWVVLSHASSEPEYLRGFGPGWRSTYDQRLTKETGIRVIRLEKLE